ncbi:MAG: DUF6458 family protein [Actinomycetota bacterium]
MGIGVSLFLLAVGAILTFAVNVEASGFDINMVGVILMIIGGLGLVLSMLFWSSWSERRRTGGDRVVVREERDVV